MIKIALAVPYKGFIENAYQIFRQHNEFYRAVDQENYEMEEVIVTSENVNQIKIEADIVLTRGLLAEILASLSKNIPVVEITVPAADILRTIRNCVEHYGKQKIGIIAAGNMLDGITELSDLSEAPIRTFVLTPDWNNEMLVKRAVSEGCKVILGGVNTCRYAAENHVSFMMIQTSQEAFWNALSDVKRTWSIFRKEQEKALRLQALLDISHDGILLIDPDFKLTAMNRKAQSVLGIDGEHLPVDALSLGGELKDVLAGDEEYVNRLVQYGSNMLNVSKNVLKIQSSICGYVVNVQAVKEIQSMEHDIRKRICKKGHIARYRFDDITGESPVMISTVETARRYSCLLYTSPSPRAFCLDKAEQEKRCSRQVSIMTASAGGCPLWLLIVLLFRNSFWKASCSVMHRGLLQERTGTERRDFLSWPTKEPFFWTRSERFH